MSTAYRAAYVVGVSIGLAIVAAMSWALGHAIAWLWEATARPDLWFSANTATGVVFVLFCMKWVWNYATRPMGDAS